MLLEKHLQFIDNNHIVPQEIIKYELICKDYNFIIHNHHWINKKIMLTPKNINYVLNNYNNEKINMHAIKITLHKHLHFDNLLF